MKQHPAWLAVGLLVLVILGCSFSTNKNSTSNSNSNSGEISKITMAKDDGNGDPGDETNTFDHTERKIHCLVTLKNPKEGIKVSFSWWIVDAGGTKNEKIKDLDYTTPSDVKVVHGHLSLPRDWPPGKYKVEASINGVLDKTVPFTVE